MEPLVSIIVPVYNVAPYLHEALDSVIHQTYRNLEILIVDDGSTDESGSICDEYQSDTRVTVIHQENRGLSGARNAGLDRMTGEYIAFLDPDDALHPDYIRSMMEAMEQENPEIIVCRYTVHHTSRKMKQATWNKQVPMLKQGKYDRPEALRSLVDGRLNTSVWNKLYKAGLWKTIRFPDGHDYEDVDIVYRILDNCESVFMLNRPLYLYRKRPGSITQTHTLKNVKDQSLAFSHLESFVLAHTPEIFSEKQLIQSRQSRINGMMSQYAHSGADKDFSEELKHEILALGRDPEINGYSFRTRTAYKMLRSCSWLFRVIYPVYRPFRLLVWKVTGK